MEQVQINLRVYPSQLEEIEDARGRLSRNAWLRQVVVARLQEERTTAVVSLAPVEEPHKARTGMRYPNQLVERQLRAAGL